MSNQTNDAIYDLASQTVGQLGEYYSDGTMPKLVQNVYDRLCTALKHDTIEDIYYLSMELAQYLAQVEE